MKPVSFIGKELVLLYVFFRETYRNWSGLFGKILLLLLCSVPFIWIGLEASIPESIESESILLSPFHYIESINPDFQISHKGATRIVPLPVNLITYFTGKGVKF